MDNSTTFKPDTLVVARIKICLIAFLFASMQCLLAGDVFSIWLDQNVGLSGKDIGILFSLKSVVAIAYKPICGLLLDKFQLNKKFIISIPILGMFMSPFFQYVYQPLLMNPDTFLLGGLLGGVYFGFVVIAGSASIFSYSDRYIRAHGGTYGVVNSFNAAGWGVMGFVSSMLYTIDPVYNFHLISVMSFILLCVFISLKTRVFEGVENEAVTKEKLSVVKLKELFTSQRFYVLLGFVMFTTVALYIQVVQMGRFTMTFWESRDEAMKTIAVLNVCASIIAFTVSMFSSRVINKIGANRSIMVVGLGVVTYFIFAASAAHFDSKAGVIFARFTFSTINPLINVVILAYVAASFNKAVNGTAYLVGFHFINNLGCAAFGPILGDVFDKVGFANGYFSLAAVSFSGIMLTGILMKFATKKTPALQPATEGASSS